MVETCWNTVIAGMFGISNWLSGFQSWRVPVPQHLGSHTKDLVVFLVGRNNAVHLSRIEQANDGELCCVYYHLLSCDPLTSMYSTIQYYTLRGTEMSKYITSREFTNPSIDMHQLRWISQCCMVQAQRYGAYCIRWIDKFIDPVRISSDEQSRK